MIDEFKISRIETDRLHTVANEGKFKSPFSCAI